MRIVVAGASGTIGRLVVEQATRAGHRVTALVRDLGRHHRFPLSVDVTEAQVVTDRGLELPDGTDAVVSTLGKRSYQDTQPVCQRGVENLVAAMGRQGVRRIVVVSASPVLRSGRGEPWWTRRLVLPYVRWAGRRIYPDLAGMEETLRDTGGHVDWTILRPGYLVDGDVVGRFTLAAETNVPGTTRRPDLAAALLQVVADRSTFGHAYGIASR